MFRRSIRLRLTLWYAAILAAGLLLFALTVYLILKTSLQDQLDDSIDSRASLLLDLVSPDTAGRLPPNLGADLEEPGEAEVFVRLFDPSGAVLYDNSPAFGEVPLDEDALASARNGSRDHRTSGEGDAEARILTMPVVRNGATVAILQVGESTEDLREILNILLLVLGVMLPATFVLAGLGGWWLSTRALRPIDGVTHAAREISGGADLSRRLNLDLPNDEVGRLARTFDEMLARLDAAFRRQRQFTADASHELRTPLTAVKGQIEVALERPRDAAEYQRVLGAVNEQVDRMTRLVGGLLMLARTDDGAVPLQRERVDVGGLVDSVAGQVRPLAEQKGLDVQVDGDGALIAYVDEDLVLQLLLNLADNAVKYTSEGGISLGWRNGDRREVFVRDSGPGIPPDHRERVFERFYRIDAARSGETGAGLGLSIARWIAEAHGGALSLQSNGAGSTFTFTLPEPS
jgi:heavy metal sensor kinase